MTDTHDFRAAVINLLTAESATWAGGEVTSETPLSDGGLDLSSLEVVRALVRIEEDLGVELSDEDIWAAEPRTVGDLLDLASRAVPRGV